MRPVFIGGCSRSGTTLLASMLGAAPSAVTVPESQFKALLLEAPTFDAKAAATAIAAHWRFRLWGIAPDTVTWGKAAGPVELLNKIVEAYAAHVGKRDASVWIDHTPENMRQARRLAELYPDARFIHIIRDGRAVTASVLDLDWGPNHAMEAGLWWAAQIAMGLAAEAHLGERIRRISYERLVTEPEAILRDLCAFLDLPFDPAMLAANGFRVRAYTAAQHALVGKPVSAERAQAWKQALSRREIELFEAAVGDLLPMLGYPLETGALTAQRSRREQVSSFARRYLTNPLRRRRRRDTGLKRRE